MKTSSNPLTLTSPPQHRANTPSVEPSRKESLILTRRHTITLSSDTNKHQRWRYQREQQQQQQGRDRRSFTSLEKSPTMMLLTNRCQSAGSFRQLLLASAASPNRTNSHMPTLSLSHCYSGLASTNASRAHLNESPSSLEMNVTMDPAGASGCHRSSRPVSRSFYSSMGSLASGIAAKAANSITANHTDHAPRRAVGSQRQRKDQRAILVEANRTLIQLCQGNMLLNDMLAQQHTATASETMDNETDANAVATVRRTQQDHQALRFLNAMISKSMQHAQSNAAAAVRNK
jgi:hypothetical protein